MVIAPTGGDKVQFTPRLLVPLTVAASVADCPPVSDALDGVTEMDTGAAATSVMAALVALVGSAALEASTVTVWEEAIVAGAVYTPPAIVPTEGEMDQFTPVLLDPLTVAISVADCPPVSDAVAGDTVMETGTRVILALTVLVGSAALAAVTVTVCAEAMLAGAV